jgi:serpin B
MVLARRELLALSGALATNLAGCVASPGQGVSGSTGDSNADPEPDASDRRVKPNVDPDQFDAVVRGNNAFAIELFQQLIKDESKEDHFISPFSVSTALAMTWAGARGGTEEAMAESLHLPFDQDDLHPVFNAIDRALEERSDVEVEEGDPLELNVANALWPSKTVELREGFDETLAKHYGARPVPLDFANEPEQSRKTINRWVAGETEDRIEELVPEGVLTSKTKLVLTNAIYFLAGWLEKFDEEETEQAPFTSLSGETRDVPMMSKTWGFPYATVDGHQVIELLYVGEQTGMIVILPKEGEFRSFQSSLDAARLEELISALEDESGTIRLPKFKVESKYRMEEALKALGMDEAFGLDANFSGMTKGGDIGISNVLHESFVTVDEEGTEAAAATAVITGDVGVSSNYEMTVDRPFLFAIRDRPTGSILFIGRVVKPPNGGGG